MGNLQEAHDFAIKIARKKFGLPPVEDVDENLLYKDYPTLKLSRQDVEDIVELFEAGFPVKEIAEVYNVTESAIRYHLQRRNQKVL